MSWKTLRVKKVNKVLEKEVEEEVDCPPPTLCLNLTRIFLLMRRPLSSCCCIKALVVFVGHSINEIQGLEGISL